MYLRHMLITSTAKRLPYSDHIVCLNPKGEVTAQGTFADLNGAGGYVSSFSLPRADWTYTPEIDDEIIQIGLDKDQDGMAVIQPKESDSDASFTLNETAYPREGEGADGTSRRTGEVQIYLYYIKSVGWIASLVFVVAITGFVFCISFPSTYRFDAIGVIIPAASVINSLSTAIWVQWWAAYNEDDPNGNLGYWLGIYAMLGGVSIVCLFISCW
jgi:ATP-binding cassette, subfamily C (CFTR/MRP), member 1